LRISSLFTYSLADTGNPNTIFDPKPIDNFLTERWLIAPHIDWKPSDDWEHKLIVAYDEERQVNDPNEDGFVGPTRAVFTRLTIDYQTNFRPARWLTLTSGFLLQRGRCRAGAALRFPALRTAADFHQRFHERAGGFSSKPVRGPCPG
jgi:hypothetical protein